MQALRRQKILSSMLTLLLAVLLLAQTVGVMHRAAHFKPMEGAYPAVVTENSSPLHALWGDHSNASDCRVFDQSCPDLFDVSGWQIPLFLSPAFWIVVSRHVRFALFERFYLAHGPPAAFH